MKTLDEMKHRFSEQCPLRYRTVNRSKLPNPERYDEVMSYQVCYDGEDEQAEEDWAPGLLLVGESGKGKTRAAWQFVKQQEENGGDFFFESAMTWANEVSKQAFAGEVNEFLDECLINKQGYSDPTNIFVLDDLSQAKWTAARAQALQHVIEKRTADGRFTMLTCQIGAEQLLEKIIKDSTGDDASGGFAAAQAIVRRLRDSTVFKVINFNK